MAKARTLQIAQHQEEQGKKNSLMAGLTGAGV
jgi:hypothetical protein